LFPSGGGHSTRMVCLTEKARIGDFSARRSRNGGRETALTADQPMAGDPRIYDDRTGHRNHLYSVAAITDDTGAVVERYGYDAYGDSVALDAAGNEIAGNESSIGQPYGFTGRRFDDETGLWYFRSRCYSDFLGRFIERNPWGQTSLYTWKYFIETAYFSVGMTIADAIAGAEGSYIQSRYILYDIADNNIVNYLEPFSTKVMSRATLGTGGIGSGAPGAAGGLGLTGLLWELIYGASAEGEGGRLKKFDKSKRRKRARQDPYQYEAVNVGRDKCGKCNPCPPPSPQWPATGPGHGLSNPCHMIVWNQTPSCLCIPKRITLPCGASPHPE